MNRKNLILLSIPVIFSFLCLISMIIVSGPFTPSFSDIFSINLQNPSIEDGIIYYLILPRTIMAVLTGAALGISGTLIQQSLQNDLASPATLGVNAGAMLTAVIFASQFPLFFSKFPTLITAAGGILTILIVYKMAKMVSDTPVNLILVGMAMTLSIGAVTTVLLMFFENRLDGLYVWGAGTLIQHDFSEISQLWWQILILGTISFFLGKGLDLISLGDDLASGLGLDVKKLRGFSVLVAILLASSITARVGLISFVGLISPHLCRFLGFRKTSSLIPASAVLGSMVVLAADILARKVSGSGMMIPTGAFTTLAGTPLMIGIILFRKTYAGSSSEPGQTGIHSFFKFSYKSTMIFLLIIASITSFFTLFSGLDFNSFYLRIPRILVAMAAGAGLAVSGTILQGLLRNPLASPDVSGLTTSGVLAVIIVINLIPGIPRAGIHIASFFGSFIAAGLLLMLTKKTYFQPQLFALTGICITGFSGTIINMILALSRHQASDVLLWMSGTTYGAGYDQVLWLFSGIIISLPFLFFAGRSLNILHLGGTWPQILGMDIKKHAAFLLIPVVVLSSTSVAAVGGISFVGLMAPHICRALGISDYKYLIPASGLTGVILLTAGDYAARNITAPFELPAGLVVSALGGPYFIFLLFTGRYLAKKE